MSIQAGWNQMLFTAGALGKIGEQNRLASYKQATDILNKAQDTLNPVVDENMRVIRENIVRGSAEVDWDDDESMDRYTDTLSSIANDEGQKLVQARQDFDNRLNVENMPSRVKKSYDQGMAEWTKQAKAKTRKTFDEAINEGLHSMSAANVRKAAQAEMAAQRAQDAAQAADMQPKNSMSPIIEQLRRNTQNAVKGGTK